MIEADLKPVLVVSAALVKVQLPCIHADRYSLLYNTRSVLPTLHTRSVLPTLHLNTRNSPAPLTASLPSPLHPTVLICALLLCPPTYPLPSDALLSPQAKNGYSPGELVDFVLELCRSNDNSHNDFDDTYIKVEKDECTRVLILCSYSTHTLRMLLSHSAHTLLTIILCSYSTHTLLTLHSHSVHTPLGRLSCRPGCPDPRGEPGAGPVD
jgi:hypothetical protein